jgi:hypothetical protein
VLTPPAETILLSDALELMQQCDPKGNPVPFSIAYLTWNDRDKMSRGIKLLPRAEMLMITAGGRHVSPNKAKAYIEKKGPSKSPRHWKNATRNIRIPGDTEIRKLNIWLIMALNNKRVIWNQLG